MKDPKAGDMTPYELAEVVTEHVQWAWAREAQERFTADEKRLASRVGL